MNILLSNINPLADCHWSAPNGQPGLKSSPSGAFTLVVPDTGGHRMWQSLNNGSCKTFKDGAHCFRSPCRHLSLRFRGSADNRKNRSDRHCRWYRDSRAAGDQGRCIHNSYNDMNIRVSHNTHFFELSYALLTSHFPIWGKLVIFKQGRQGPPRVANGRQGFPRSKGDPRDG